ncbi:SMI1-KNR4 cell-wall [Paenibacillaceae bacterium GAS479]|nr:SMI1-KNR4 cell-wall [Paenibacillaceae bacterium GAS479]
MSDTRVLNLIQFLKQHASSEHHFQRLVPGMDVAPLECTWETAATEVDISKCLSTNNWFFPEDYKKFLLQHNGAVLFKEPYYGGGTELLSIEKMQIISQTYENIPPHCFPFAWTDHRIGAVCMDSIRCREGEKPYLFFLDAMDFMEEAIPIPLTFTEWFERLITCQGQEYWNWK